MIGTAKFRKSVVIKLTIYLFVLLLQSHLAQVHCAVPLDIVTEKVIPLAMKKRQPAIVPMIPDKEPLISARKCFATLHSVDLRTLKAICNWWTRSL
ncbi:unnamed protein product, partial [Iphiclides podalirius]